MSKPGGIAGGAASSGDPAGSDDAVRPEGRASDWDDRVREAFARLGPAPDRAVGRELRRVRREAGLAQRPAAALLPIDQSKISRTESGRRRLSLLEAVEVCLSLGVPLSDLVPEPLRALLSEVAPPDGSVATRPRDKAAEPPGP